MARGFKSFSSGERRGLLALLIILSIIVAVSYFSMRPTVAQSSIATSNDTAIISNIFTAKDTSTTKKRRVKKKRKLKTKTAPPVIKPRDPLSQPVPLQEN